MMSSIRMKEFFMKCGWVNIDEGVGTDELDWWMNRCCLRLAAFGGYTSMLWLAACHPACRWLRQGQGYRDNRDDI